MVMRDYIFHGKSIDTDEWVEGYLSYNKVRKQYYIMDDFIGLTYAKAVIIGGTNE